MIEISPEIDTTALEAMTRRIESLNGREFALEGLSDKDRSDFDLSRGDIALREALGGMVSEKGKEQAARAIREAIER